MSLVACSKVFIARMLGKQYLRRSDQTSCELYGPNLMGSPMSESIILMSSLQCSNCRKEKLERRSKRRHTSRDTDEDDSDEDSSSSSDDSESHHSSEHTTKKSRGRSLWLTYPSVAYVAARSFSSIVWSDCFVRTPHVQEFHPPQVP